MKTKLLPLLLLTAALHAQPVSVTTSSYSNGRSGMNSRETTLTQASIATKGLRLLATIPVFYDKRGMEAKPLIAAQVQTATKGTRDLLILPSMSDYVRVVDATTGESIWERQLATAICVSGNQSDCSSNRIDMHRINDHWGCLSTGVIVMPNVYLSCWVSTDGSGRPESGQYQMFVLDVATGRQVVAPVNLQGADRMMWKQRSALTYLPTRGVILIPHGSVYETSTGFTGGITAFDVATNKVTTQLQLPEGIWQGGQGLVCDSKDVCYAITANGDFDPGKGWFGEAFIKIVHDAIGIHILDQWSPWNDFQRSGQQKVPAGKLAGENMASQRMQTPVGGGMMMSMKGARKVPTVNDQGQKMTLYFPPPMAQGDFADEDWGSAPPSCFFDLGFCVATGKDGIGYPISTYVLGFTTAANVGTQANYAKLAGPCVWLTMSPGRGIPCDPVNPRDLNFLPNGVTAHLHASPVRYYDPILKSQAMLVWGENNQGHIWAVAPGAKLTYVGETNEFASEDVRRQPPGGMTGGMCTGSSNGNDPGSMVMVCALPLGDANKEVTRGRLIAYDVLHRVNGAPRILWDSQQWGWNFAFSKFNPPVIANGKIYYTTYDGRVLVLGVQ